MFFSRLSSAGRSWFGATTVIVALLAGGCDDEVGKRYPVSGRVTLNGVPLQGKTGSVVFKPDLAQGNKSIVEAIGEIDAEGNFTLSTKGKAGAPLGKCKVIVSVSEPGKAQANNRTGTGRARRSPPTVVPARYTNEATSGLVVEVVAEPAPGSYNLNLTK